MSNLHTAPSADQAQISRSTSAAKLFSTAPSSEADVAHRNDGSGLVLDALRPRLSEDLL